MASEADKAAAAQYLGISLPENLPPPATNNLVPQITPTGPVPLNVPVADPLAGLVPNILTMPPEQITAGQPPWSEPTDLEGRRRRAELTGTMPQLEAEYNAAALAGNDWPSQMINPAQELAVQAAVPEAEQAALEMQIAQQQANEMSAPPVAAAPAAAPITEDDFKPDTKSVMDARQKIVKPAQEAIAEQNALQEADDQLKAAAIAARERADKLTNEVSKLDEDIRSQIRNKSLPEMLNTGSWAGRIMSGLAIMAGGVGGALKGEQGNVVLDQINKGVEQQAQRDKLNNEQRMALKREALDSVKTQIDALQARTQNAAVKANLENAKQQMALERERMNASIMEAHQKKALNAELAGITSQGTSVATKEIANHNARINGVIQMAEIQDPKLADSYRARAVTTPDGRITIANVDKERVAAFQKASQPKVEALKVLEDLRDFAGNAHKLNIKDRQRMSSKLIQAAGILRESVLGPGQMTKEEYERLLTGLGNPLAIFSFRDVEDSKLESFYDRINGDLRSSAKMIGVNWPATEYQKLHTALVKDGYSEKAAAAAVLKKKKQDRGEL